MSVLLGMSVLAAACGSKPEYAKDPDDAGSAGGGDARSGAGNETGLITIGMGDASSDVSVVRDDGSTPASLCGDGVIQAAEACDDGNPTPGDGCSGICTIEPGYKCESANQACVYAPTMVCGNGQIEASEPCDDGNTVGNDGCSATCVVEPGYACDKTGCKPVSAPAKCGDGLVNQGETCDDGGNDASAPASGDGCSSTCQTENGFECKEAGKPCTKLEFCGDGVVQGNIGEECDDGNGKPADGCSGVCKIENGYACGDAGGGCTRLWICGNGKVDPGEACDDGNTMGLDGCADDCTYVEGGFTCPKAPDGTGGGCVPAPQNTCGDAILGPSEQCDDGNKADLDGCSALCKVESGFTCDASGKNCTRILFCGDGKVSLELGEDCDDSNANGGDGCSKLCKRELGFTCPVPPLAGACTAVPIVCGDGAIGGTEQCDDRNTAAGDGCDGACQREVGWTCPAANAPCIATACGDGVIAGSEQCDDGNTSVVADGCSATCKLQPGFACATTNKRSTCHATTCGDATQEGFEQCEDHNLVPYDGCSPTCTIEPKCAGGQCTPVCGDGLKFPQEACDDGNVMPGDGCSASCTLEGQSDAGPNEFDCTLVTLSPPTTLDIPILFRDMLYTNTSFSADGGVIATGHPDFQLDPHNGSTGLVMTALDAEGKPTYKSGKGNANSATLLQSPTSFYWWYHDKQCAADGGACTQNPYANLVYLDVMGKPTKLTFDKISGDAGVAVYQYSSGTFFPVDGLGWNASAATRQVSNNHNFSFTSELRYQFTYFGGEILDFTGDDDVWVFINGKLAVDIGGVHSAQNKSITLNAANATTLGLTVGGMYEIALFQAERHTTASNYKLTLSGFVRQVTQCLPHCGDGKVRGDELCDDGKNDGSYGSCLPGCTGRAGYCGDNTLQAANEQCDDGNNNAGYGGVTKQCAPGCKWAPYCGDGATSNGEECDEGAMNGSGYGHCTAACKIGPRCGDGKVDAPDEACDNGNSNGASADPCSASCKLKCGDGVKDPGEQCDDGAGNAFGYGKCQPTCTLGPRCGDGFKNGVEECDDGKNDGSYGTCKPDCKVAAYCGDGTLDNPPEQCDRGSQNDANAYGKNLCTNACKPSPYCGDKAVDGTFGEKCDDGVNSGMAGSCTTDCKDWVRLQSCGDGTVQPPEQCDWAASDGGASATCDMNCRFKCGNGVKDTGEDCDNGTNDGSYGTCTGACKLAGHCGDGTKNGPEACDNGKAGNVALSNAYGKNVCTAVCSAAPYCGDGRVQAQFGEQCDGDADCDGSCRLTIVN
ncbi:MAG TPA: DUF4215 domain-containing protein [Polyangiaceae bacterium]|nr:DUF4215 domain-containing protein [Polyangiaceae bacterium]